VKLKIDDRVMLVEGQNDMHVVKNLFKVAGLTETFVVTPVGSLEMVLKRLPLDLKSEHVRALGVMVDADSNLADRWAQL
jgi:hypothetical protein